MQTDRYGLALSTSSPASRDAYVEGCDLLLTLYPGAVAAFDRAIAADPGFARRLKPCYRDAARTGTSRLEQAAGIVKPAAARYAFSRVNSTRSSCARLCRRCARARRTPIRSNRSPSKNPVAGTPQTRARAQQRSGLPNTGRPGPSRRSPARAPQRPWHRRPPRRSGQHANRQRPRRDAGRPDARIRAEPASARDRGDGRRARRGLRAGDVAA
jgi:hypothetical protein